MKNVEMLNNIYGFASSKHKEVNHKYDYNDYSYHLKMVANIAEQFQHLIINYNSDVIFASCYCHDLIEDTRLTYNDLKIKLSDLVYDCNLNSYFYHQDCEKFAIEVTEIVYALTNEKGRNRKERANDKYYQGIRNTKYATFIKLCDRIANIKHCKLEGNKLEMYKRENSNFINQLYIGEGLLYKEMFDYIDELLK